MGPLLELSIFQCLYVTYEGSNCMCVCIYSLLSTLPMCASVPEFVFKDISWHCRSLQDISPIPKEMRDSCSEGGCAFSMKDKQITSVFDHPQLFSIISNINWVLKRYVRLLNRANIHTDIIRTHRFLL